MRSLKNRRTELLPSSCPSYLGFSDQFMLSKTIFEKSPLMILHNDRMVKSRLSRAKTKEQLTLWQSTWRTALAVTVFSFPIALFPAKHITPPLFFFFALENILLPRVSSYKILIFQFSIHRWGQSRQKHVNYKVLGITEMQGIHSDEIKVGHSHGGDGYFPSKF